MDGGRGNHETIPYDLLLLLLDSLFFFESLSFEHEHDIKEYESLTSEATYIQGDICGGTGI